MDKLNMGSLYRGLIAPKKEEAGAGKSPLWDYMM